MAAQISRQAVSATALRRDFGRLLASLRTDQKQIFIVTVRECPELAITNIHMLEELYYRANLSALPK